MSTLPINIFPSSAKKLLPLQILGLQICSDTLVGNDMARGISGGQRKRVTIGALNLYIELSCNILKCLQQRLSISVFKNKNVTNVSYW
jgi:hypothetical protein